MNEEIEAQVKEKIIEYTILIHKAEKGGFWVEVPALPGCYSQSETFGEIIRR